MNINLKELAEQLDTMMDEWSYFIHKKSGEIVTLDNTYLAYAEESDEEEIEHLADWEYDEIAQASTLLEHWDEYISFPDKYEINAYAMMEDFIETITNTRIHNNLCIAIEGRGAFRRFKDTAGRFGVLERWYDFKNHALLEFAAKWCEENNLPYEKEKNE